MSFDLNVAVAASAIAAAVLSILTKLAERILLFRWRPRRLAINSYRTANCAIDPLEPALERLRDARAALDRQKTIARTNKRMSIFLITGQYIVGGLLASSFIQQSLAKETVGALGVVVLLSSPLSLSALPSGYSFPRRHPPSSPPYGFDSRFRG